MGSRAFASVLVIAAVAFAALALTSGYADESPQESLPLEPTSVEGLLVELLGGNGNAPEEVHVRPGDAGAPDLLQLELVRNGLDPRVRVVVAGPDEARYELRGTILVLGDASASSLKLQVNDGTTEALSARITRVGDAPSVRVWLNGTPEKHSYALEPSVRQQSGADGSLRALAVRNPDGTGGDAVRLSRSATGYELWTAHASRDIPSDRATVGADAKGAVLVRLADHDGNVVQTITIDRASEPALVTLTGLVEQQLAGPVSLEGDPANPKRLSVYDADGSPVVEYVADGGAARLDMGGETVLADATLVAIEGDPFGEAFRLQLRDLDGDVHELPIDRGLLLDEAPEAAILLSPLSDVGGAPAADLKSVRDPAGNALDEADLDGREWLQRKGPHVVYLETEEDASWFEQVKLQVSTAAGASNVTFQPMGAYAERQTWAATYTPTTGADGDRVTLDVHLERRLAPLALQRYTLERSFSYKVDGTSPTATLTAPATASDFKFEVAWSGADALTGISGYEVHAKRPGEATWTPWIDGAKTTKAIFSGDWGQTYQLRARSLDGVGNPSEWKEATVVVAAQPAGSDDVNDAPSVRLLAPRAGDRLADLVQVSWEASDPDGTPVVVTVELSADDGATWRTLYSGPESTVLWNTHLEPNGDKYRVRLTATDGTRSAVDASGAFAVLNAVEAAEPSPGSTGGQTGSAGNGGAGSSDGGAASPTGGAPSAPADGGDADTPAPGLVGAFAAIGVALYALRSRRSR